MNISYKYLNLMLIGFFTFGSINAATIEFGDVTSNLSGTLFIDEAATGGGDFTVQDDGGANGDGRVSVAIRSLNYGVGQPGTITISGFGFASSATTAANDATSVNLEFYYLGADGVADGLEDPEPDDVLIGIVQNITYAHQGAGTYYVNFGEESVSAQIDGANDKFRVWIKVNDLDAQLQESIRFKTQTGVGSKISISGTFEAGTGNTTWAGYPVQDGGFVDTGSLMGILWVGDGNQDWIYAFNLRSYIYLPADLVDANAGSWAYVPKP